MSESERAGDYLVHILQAVERIDRYTSGLDLAGFLASELVQDAVIRNIEVIGEASNKVLRVAPDFASRNDDIPWRVLYTMRNRVSHAYDKVDLEIVWKAIRDDLPELYQRVRTLAARTNG